MSVSRAGWHKYGGDGNAAVVELDRAGIVAESRNKIELQRDVLSGGYLFDVRDELPIGQFAKGVEHHAGTAAEDFLSGLWSGSGHIVGNTYLQSKTDIGIDDVRRGRGTAHFNAAFFLNCADIEDLIGVSNVLEAAHHLEHHTAADTFAMIDPKGLQENAALVAVLGYAMSSVPEELIQHPHSK